MFTRACAFCRAEGGKLGTDDIGVIPKQSRLKCPRDPTGTFSCRVIRLFAPALVPSEDKDGAGVMLPP